MSRYTAEVWIGTAKNYFANQLNDMAGENADFCDFSRCFQLYGPKQEQSKDSETFRYKRQFVD